MSGLAHAPTLATTDRTYVYRVDYPSISKLLDDVTPPVYRTNGHHTRWTAQEPAGDATVTDTDTATTTELQHALRNEMADLRTEINRLGILVARLEAVTRNAKAAA